MAHIEIYTRPGCGYCTHAKQLLVGKGLAFTEYDVYKNPPRASEMRSRTQGRTYPQLFIDQVALGGFEDLLKMEQQNRLPKSITQSNHPNQ